jgi:MFS family permease
MRAIVALLACGLVALLDGADALSLAMASPLLAKALGISSGMMGWVFSFAALGSGLGYLGGGVLADHWGAKATVTASLAVVGMFQLMTNVAADPGTLIVVRFIVCLGLGGAVPGLVALVSQISPPGLQHRLVGFLWACFPVGVLGGGVVNGWILEHSRWQDIFVVGGIAPLLIALAVWRIVPGSATRDTATSRSAGLTVGLIQTLRQPPAVLTALIFFFTNGAIAIVMNWTPSLLVRSGFAPSVGAHALAWNAAGALLSMSVTGFIVERSRIAPIAAGLAISTVATILLSLWIDSLPMVTLLMMILGSTLALAGTASVFVAGSLVAGDQQATGIGLCMAIGRVGQTVFPALFGWSLQAGDSPAGALLWSAALPAGGCIAAGALYWRTDGRQKPT